MARSSRLENSIFDVLMTFIAERGYRLSLITRMSLPRYYGVCIMAMWAMSAIGQVPPDAGRIQQETRPQPEHPPPGTLPPIRGPTLPHGARPVAEGDVRVQVTRFDFTGNSSLSSETLRQAIAPWAGRSLTFGELMQAVEAVEARYKQAGYFLAQGYLPPQKIRDGTIEIAISEGRLGEIRLEGESHVSPDVLYAYLDRLPRNDALVLSTLERQVLLIDDLAGIRASLDLQAGDKPGTTDVVLIQQPEDLFTGRLDVDNHGLPSTGEKRLSVTLSANSALNLGERVTFNVLSSENRRITSYYLRGELPIGGDGWRLTASASRAEYSLGGAFSNLEASGSAEPFSIGVSYPLIRRREANLRVQIEADRSRLVDRYRSIDTEFDKQTRGVTASLSGDWLDELIGGGSTRVDLALRVGRLNLGPAASAIDAPPFGPAAAGNFSKTTLTIQRQQTVTRGVSLQFLLSGQQAGKNLDSSEKFMVGGPTTLPGYAAGEAIGDSGVYARLGLRWQAMPELALTAFTDYARLRLAHDPLPTATTNHKRLTDTGIGADWMLGKNFSANAILAWAGKEAPNPADNDKPRLWFTLSYAW